MVVPLGTAAAALAGGATLAAYLNAKFHIRKDLSGIARMKRSERAYARAAAQGRINPWFVFEETVQKYPDVICIWTRQGEYTFQQVHDLAIQYGHFFLSLGVKPRQLVAFYLQNRAEFLVAWLGLWSIGCSPAAINYHLAGDALVHCLQISGAKIVLVDEDEGCRARVEGVRTVLEGELGMKLLTLDASLKEHVATFSTAASEEEKKYRLNVRGDFPSILLYTSGTTGLPKGCAFTMSRLYIHGMARRGAFDEKPGRDRWYCPMPLYHGTGAMSIIIGMLAGVGAAIAPRFSVRDFWRDVRDSQSTAFVYVGETVRYLLAAPPSPDGADRNHNVRFMYGNGLRSDVWEKFRQRFGVPEVVEFFSSTEGVFGLVNYDRGPYLSSCVGHHGLINRALFHNIYVPVAIDPDTGDILRDPVTGFATRMPYEIGGEILVRVPDTAAFQGYWSNPSATEKKFLRDVFHKGDLYYRSGDALRRTPDGHWHFLDRLGDTFRWKSENVSTAEVAQVLGQFPGIVEANVYGVVVPHHEGRAGCAALQISPDAKRNFDFRALARHARARLPRYAVPVFLRVVEWSSHIHNNKQNKVPLRDEGVDPDKVGTKVGSQGRGDRFLWLSPGQEGYVEFGKLDWDQLVEGRAKL